MVKKRKLKGAALRSRKRQKEQLEAMQERQADEAASRAIVDQADSGKLFVLDGAKHSSRDGGGIAAKTRGQVQEDAFVHRETTADKKKSSNKKQEASAIDSKKVARLLQKHSTEQLQKMAQEGRETVQRLNEVNQRNQGVLRKGRFRADKQQKAFDLWGDNDDEGEDGPSSGKPKSKNNSKKVSSSLPTPGIGATLAGIKQPAAKSSSSSPSTNLAPSTSSAAAIAPLVVDTVHAAGQSYRPEPVAHNKLLRQAVDIEERRSHAEQYLKTPLSQGLSEETKQFMDLDSSSDEESDSDDESASFHEEDKIKGNGEAPALSTSTTIVVDRSNKLTRSQRNKQKRQRQARRLEEQSHSERKRLRHEFAQLPKFQKELKRQELEEHDRRRERKLKKEEKKKELATTEWATLMSKRHALSAPTLPVVLPSELERPTQQQPLSTTNTSAAGSSSTSSLRTLQPKGSLVAATTDRLLLSHSGAIGKKSHERKRDKNARKRRRVAVQNKGTTGPDFAVLG